MNIEIGDKVRVINYKEPDDQTQYTVLSFCEAVGIQQVRIKHPTVPGVFTIPIIDVVEVFSENRISNRDKK